MAGWSSVSTSADSDVIDVVHVSVQWLWCVTEAAVQKHH